MHRSGPRWSDPWCLALLLAGIHASSFGVAWAEPLFQAPLFKVGSGPRSIAAGDFNGDGRIDIAVANSGSNDVSVLLGTDHGVFLQEVRVGAGLSPSALAIADLNRDGRLDLVVANAGSDDLSLFLGHGDGSFAPQGRLTVGDDPSSIALGDVNRDGFIDVVVANRGSDDISILTGYGDGTFSNQVRTDAGRRPLRVVLADISGDGALDLAVENGGDLSPSAYGDVTILFNAGSGSFYSRDKILYSSDFTFTLGDFNHDGFLDMALVDRGGLIRIYKGQGSSGFSFETDQGALVGYYSGAAAAADLNLDGNLDLVSVSRDSNAAWVAFGNGDFTFRYPSTMVRDGGTYPLDVAIGDFDGDAKLDLAIVNQSSNDVSLLRGNGDGSLSLQPRLVTTGPPVRMVGGDFNSDGRPDLAVLTASALEVYKGDGQGGFAAPEPLPVGEHPRSLATGDFDADGLTDLAVTDLEIPDVFILLEQGDGSFAPAKRVPLGFIPTDLAAGDFDADGRSDLACLTGCLPGTSCNQGAVVVLLGKADGSFGQAAYYAVGVSPFALAVGDFDGDGIRDLAALNAAGLQIVSELHGYGNGTFAPQRQILLAYYGSGVSATGMAVGDWQGDGKDDIALPVLDLYNDYAILLNGTPYGLFISGNGLPTGDDPFDAASDDFDADGHTDFVTANLFTDNVVLALHAFNDPFGTASPQSYPAVDCASVVVSEDFNLDGRADLAVGSFCNPEIAVMLNVGPFPDADGDGLPDSEDPCTDPDRDGFGSPGYAANICLIDNCPKVSNSTQADGDGDGVGDTCDDCPGTANPGQEDRDTDGAGDACDACTDIDHDGYGSPGYGLNSCPLDNCPFNPNPNQADLDGDGVGDVCDTCTDPDHDGYASPGFQGTLCGVDNCPNAFNPGQENSDGDFRGDACDACPLDPGDDYDRDGRCADQDNCPVLYNPDQADAEGDGVGDRCDNCPNAANPDQQDGNEDGAGDACQPTVTIDSVRQDGGPVLEVSARARDPQREPLAGSIAFFEFFDVTLHNHGLEGVGCDIGFALPEWQPGEGLAYLSDPQIGGGVLFDLDWLSSLAGLPPCEDGIPDFSFWRGSCATTHNYFGENFYAQEGDFCIRRTFSNTGGNDFTILQFDDESLRGTISASVPSLTITFETGLPRRSDISSLIPGKRYRLVIRASDGVTPAVSAEGQFLYQGESTMVINSPPLAAIAAPGRLECDRPAGAVVDLDGTASSDADSSPSSNDDIVKFEWLENPGQPNETLIGVGPRVPVTLAQGEHAIGLRVTDSQSAMDVAQTTLSVDDTTAPTLACPPIVNAECTSPDGAQVDLIAQASDACDRAIAVTSSRGGADAGGEYPLGLTSVRFTATDASGNAATCTTDVIVRDTTPPRLSVALSPTVLWPPNHRMVPVQATWSSIDACDPGPTVSLMKVESSEPDDAPGGEDGDTTEDITAAIGTADPSLSLRAERSGDGSGRTYLVTYLSEDASGNMTSALAVATVPHDLGHGPEPLLINLEHGVTPGMVHVYWSQVEGATGYDLIAGDLEAVRFGSGQTWLGAVRTIATGVSATSFSELPGAANPVPGRAFFYLVAWRDAEGWSSGYGTESAPRPRQPGCDGGCPGP